MPNDSRKDRIENELRKALKPTHLTVTNESYMDLANSDKDQQRNLESRYSIIISSIKLKELSRSQGQRMINQLLKHEFMDGLKSLSIQII